MITYDIAEEPYRHWVLTIEPPVATLRLGAKGAGDARGSGGDDSDAELCSLLRADIELADALRRLRFERPEVTTVVVTGATDDAFCTEIAGIPAGAPADVAANVRAFRYELHSAIEDASAHSGLHWLAALNGSASGPGYELALAADEIVLVDDGRSAVALPGLSRVGEPPSVGAVARLVEKRHVRPDLVDTFCCSAAGVCGQRALDWGLVDRTAPEHCFADVVDQRVRAAAESTARGPASEAVEFGPLRREEFDGGFAYPTVRVDLDREAGQATLVIVGPPNHECFAPDPGPKRLRSRWWPLAVCRELDDALLLLRSYQPEIGCLVLRTEGDPLAVASADVAMTSGYEHDWFVREVVLYWARMLKRLDRAWQSVIALVEPGSCFVGTLLELAFAADRIYMVEGPAPGDPDGPAAEIILTGMNFGPLPRASGRTRLESRFPTLDDHVAALALRVGDLIPAAEAAELGLVTEAIPPAVWESRTRRAIAERAGLSFAARAALAALKAREDRLDCAAFEG